MTASDRAPAGHAAAEPAAELAAALAAHAVRWCLLRDSGGRAEDGAGAGGCETGESRIGGCEIGDDDLLVHPDDLARFDGVLGAAGFARRPAWGHGNHRFYYRYEPCGGWAKLDVVTALRFGRSGEFRTDAAAHVLAGAAGAPGGPPRPRPADAFWVLLLHCLLDRAGSAGRHADTLAELAGDQAEGCLAARVGTLLGEDATAELLADVRTGTGDLRRHAERLARAWRDDDAAAVLARTAARALAVRTRPVFTALNRRGVAVAVLGPDGAGKSSAVAALAATYPFPVRAVYAGQYQGAASGRPRRELPGGHTATLVARQLKQSATARWSTLRGRTVLFDRFAYDSRLPRAGASAKTRARRALLARASLRPDLVVVLDAPGEVLHRRSGEHSPEALEEQRRGYRTLAGSLGRRAAVVNADAEAPLVLREVTAAVWRAHHAAWRGGRR